MSDDESWRLTVTILYFAIHVLLMESPFDKSLLIHHAFVGGSVVLSLYYSYLTWYITALMFNECSTIFLNARLFLIDAGLKTHPIYIINGIAPSSSFFL